MTYDFRRPHGWHIFTLCLITTSALAQQGPTTPAEATPGVEATTAATQEYLKTGLARPVRSGDFLVFPYGMSQPTLSCAPLRTCLIRLQAGETVLGTPALGDSERWMTGLLRTGPKGNTPVVYVKPIMCDITTNLVIATDRRLYQVMLDAPPCDMSPTNRATDRYTVHVAFYYPEDAAQDAAMRANDIVVTPTPASGHPDDLHFAYTIHKDRRFPWRPEHVFDDGVHLYIKRPADAAHRQAPLLFGVNADGSRLLLNVTIRRDYYITDRVVERAILVVQDGRHEQRLTLVRRGATP